MALSVSNIAPPAASSGGGDHIPKSELVGATIAYSVKQFNPNFEGDYGKTSMVEVDLIVLDGPHSGHRDDSWVAFGNLAKSMGESKVGDTVIAVVEMGDGKVPGSKWYGVDRNLSDSDHAAAVANLTALLTSR